MVLQNRLDYGFNGYQVPLIPRGTRSARRRRAISKKVDDRQMCAFDLLATVAGKLLLEGESSPSSSNSLTGTIVKGSIKKERLDEDNPSKVEPCGRRSCDRSSFVSELVSQTPVLHHSSKEFSHVHNDDCSGVASVITSDCSEKVGSAEKLVSGKGKIQLGSFASKVEVASSGYQESCDCTLEDENKNKKQIKIEPPKTGNASNNTKADMCSSDDLAVRDRKPPTPVSLDNSVKLPLCTDYIPSGSFPACRDDVKLVIRDDDENSSGCTQPSTATKAFRPPPRIGKRRIRKLLASKYWKVTPKLKDEKHFNADSETRSVYHNRKIGYKCKRSLTDYPIKKRIFYDRSSVANSDGGISSEGISSSPRKGLSYSETRSVYHNRKIGYKRKRSLTDYPIKKRIFYDRSSVSNSDGGISSEGISSSPRKGLSCDASGSGATIHGASGTSACVAGLHTPFQSRDSHVKVRITSFKVPELFIEMPETATVGSLKRSVMEAVTAILGGGLRVGVLLQGKKIRDENKTLLQTGISRDNKLDALGFSLEPNPSQAAPPLCHEDHTFLLACDTPQPLTRYPPAPSVVHNVVEQSTADASPDPPLTNAGNFVDSDHDSAPSPPDMSIDKSPTDSRALVAVPAMNVEALSVVPMRKSKRSEAVQRRIRRPFSVSEVEALVQAVEKLGTGRWRDVKLRAFDNAKHRTYVDLKDKWKTLVHTARISPQQRRGEPVPQELLDRVLAAHAYWSQQQAKQQLKQQLETCLL